MIRGVTKSLEKGFNELSTPFKAFIHDQTTTSVILVVATLTAIFLANSPYSHDYKAFFETTFGVIAGEHRFRMSLHHWINDAFMSLFFFIIGLEIKRELLAGELSSLKQTTPVIAAAIGGMIAPAAIFAAINASSKSLHGWGIPMATDTAFVIGILALLRHYVPAGVVVFVTALAIIDDIGAILVITFFYTGDLSLIHLSYSAVILAFMMLLNLIGIRRPIAYLISGGFLWLATLESGIHATVAGILAATAVPARPKHDPGWFINRMRLLIQMFERREKYSNSGDTILADQKQHDIVEKIHDVADNAGTPLQHWENALERPVALLVLPVFALANAGILIDMDDFSQHMQNPLLLGIVFGLVIGKLLGITGMTWIILKLRWGTLSSGIEFPHVIGIGLLAGIGFTMSVFIAGMGFSAEPEQLMAAKTGTILASLISGCSGYLWLRFAVAGHRRS